MACWSQARRKFYELHEAGSPLATEALARIGAIYKVETSIRGQLPDARRQVRQEQSNPLVEALHAGSICSWRACLAEAVLAEAIRYALGRWTALGRFLEDGRIDLDTNPVECAIRPVSLGRKNALFAGSRGNSRP